MIIRDIRVGPFCLWMVLNLKSPLSLEGWLGIFAISGVCRYPLEILAVLMFIAIYVNLVSIGLKI